MHRVHLIGLARLATDLSPPRPGSQSLGCLKSSLEYPLESLRSNTRFQGASGDGGDLLASPSGLLQNPPHCPQLVFSGGSCIEQGTSFPMNQADNDH